MLTRSTPEGARDYLVPNRRQPGTWYALPQSPQLFKQLLMMGGLERYFQIVRCFRDEDFRADRQPEFTQLDVELSFVEEDDVMSMCDALMPEVLALGGIELGGPIERIPYDEALLRYGTDRPDRRIPIEIADLGEVFAAAEFKVFSGALGGGGVVRGLSASGDFPRSRFDALTEKAQSLGAKGLVWGKVESDGWRSPVAKFLSEGEIAGLIEATGAGVGDAILVVADKPATAARCASTSACRARATTCCGSPTSRCSTSTPTSAATTRSTIRSQRPAGTWTPTPGRGGAAPTTWCGTAPSWAAGPSASTPRRCSPRSSPRWGCPTSRRASSSASCSRR
jgi:aspartyl-tRNA synthetase